ncbi:hypothetical protein [Candidatus Poriferisocius sp.]|uniref:hypothetical protein n=1 Tax=Candidatus Poriferisocius sp. TaxID=3101276 RepID=UPI003B01A84C
MGAHPFLSPEWIEAATALRDELAPVAPDPVQTARVNLVVAESPFGDGEFRAYIDTGAGGPLPVPGSLDCPDATVMLDYPAALAAFVADDPDIVAQGFLTGALRVDGDLALVLILFGEGMTDEQAAFARHAQTRLRAITVLSDD